MICNVALTQLLPPSRARLFHSAVVLFICFMTFDSSAERHRGNTNITTESPTLPQYQTSEETLQRWYQQTFLNWISQPPNARRIPIFRETVVEHMRLDRFQRNELIEYALSRAVHPNLPLFARVLFAAERILSKEDWRSQARNLILERNLDPLALWEHYEHVRGNGWAARRGDDWFRVLASTSDNPRQMLERFEKLIEMSRHNPASMVGPETIKPMYELLLSHPKEFTQRERNMIRDRLRELSLGDRVSLWRVRRLRDAFIFGVAGAGLAGILAGLGTSGGVDPLWAAALRSASAFSFSAGATLVFLERGLVARWSRQQTIRVLRFTDALLSGRCLRAFSLFGDLF